MKNMAWFWSPVGMVFLLSFFLSLVGSNLYQKASGAQGDFPKKEITIIVNYAPGGGRDNVARGLSKIFGKYLGVPVNVTNIPGEGGVTGLIKLYKSVPDGYTIGIGSETDIIDQIMEKRPYDFRDFLYIGNIQNSAGIFYVRSDSVFHSVKDFKTYGKPVRHASFSLTAAPTIVAMVLAKRENFPLEIIKNYPGSADTLRALIRGEVDFSNNSLSVSMPFVKSQQIRPILVIAQKRSSFFPEIPTIGEEGHPDLADLTVHFWLMAPPGVPKERMQILEGALMKTFKDPEFLESFKKANVELGLLTGEETRRFAYDFFNFFEKYKGDLEKPVRK